MTAKVDARPADVSVVINVYDNEATIGEALESVLRQTWPPGEVVVIDDGSTDGSGDVARAFGERVRVLRQDNRGISAARNRGVAEARGSLIASVDADDCWRHDKLERQLPLLVEGVEGVTCHVAQVSDGLWAEIVSGARPPDDVRRGPVWETLVIRRDAFERIGVFDETYRIAEQIDWWTRAADLGLRLVDVSEPLVYRRVHAENHGIRQSAIRADEYMRAVQEAMRRRRATAARSTVDHAADRAADLTADR